MPSEGRSGGLALLWKPKTYVNIKGYSKWYIDAEVVCRNVQGCWRFTSFYGQPDTSKMGKKLGKFWKLLAITIHYHGFVSVTIMKFLVILKSWEGSLDRNNKWIDFVRWWIYASLGTWGTQVPGTLG